MTGSRGKYYREISTYSPINAGQILVDACRWRHLMPGDARRFHLVPIAIREWQPLAFDTTCFHRMPMVWQVMPCDGEQFKVMACDGVLLR
jgi:hypothetical protein